MAIHKYEPSVKKPGFCDKCGFASNLHGEDAECESCTTKGQNEPGFLKGKAAMLCPECNRKEMAIIAAEVADYQTPEKQQARLDAYNATAKPYEQLIRDARKIDESIHVSTDIFNAKTVSFQEFREAILKDDSIPSDKKHFEMARIAKERIKHFSAVIFELDRAKIEAYSEQKSWHIQLNELANKLRLEDREQLKISDITYDVKMPKTVTPRAIKMSQKAPSKIELRKVANELGMPEHTIQLVMTSKNWNLEQVATHFRRSINEGKSMSEPKKPEHDGLPPVDMDEDNDDDISGEMVKK